MSRGVRGNALARGLSATPKGTAKGTRRQLETGSVLHGSNPGRRPTRAYCLSECLDMEPKKEHTEHEEDGKKAERTPSIPAS